jgi:hypothetical protein
MGKTVLRDSYAPFLKEGVNERGPATLPWIIAVMEENGFAPVAAIHEVVDSAGIFHAQFASPARRRLTRNLSGQWKMQKDRTPRPLRQVHLHNLGNAQYTQRPAVSTAFFAASSQDLVLVPMTSTIL